MNQTIQKVKVEYGDFQTPIELTQKICQHLIKLDLSENSQPSHSKPSPHFLEIPQSI